MTNFLTTTPHQDELFTNSDIIEQAVELLRYREDTNVRVSALWERKGYPQSGPLNTESPYRQNGGDIQVTMTVIISEWEQVVHPAKGLLDAVEQELTERHDARIAAQKAKKVARIAELQAELDALNAAE